MGHTCNSATQGQATEGTCCFMSDMYTINFPLKKVKRNLSCRNETKFGKEDCMSTAISPNSAFSSYKYKVLESWKCAVGWNERTNWFQYQQPKLLKTRRATSSGQSTVSASRHKRRVAEGAVCDAILSLGGELGIWKEPFSPCP